MIAADTRDELAHEADDVVCVLAPADFDAASRWYADFPATTDAEVSRLIAGSRLG